MYKNENDNDDETRAIPRILFPAEPSVVQDVDDIGQLSEMEVVEFRDADGDEGMGENEISEEGSSGDGFDQIDPEVSSSATYFDRLTEAMADERTIQLTTPIPIQTSGALLAWCPLVFKDDIILRTQEQHPEPLFIFRSPSSASSRELISIEEQPSSDSGGLQQVLQTPIVVDEEEDIQFVRMERTSAMTLSRFAISGPSM